MLRERVMLVLRLYDKVDPEKVRLLAKFSVLCIHAAPVVGPPGLLVIP